MRARHLAVVGVLGLALALAGCVNEAQELGQPPPVQLTVARRTLVVALQGDPRLRPGAREQLRSVVTELGGASPLGVRARISAASAGDADAVRRALLGLGVDPAHIVIERTGDVRPLRPLVRLTRSFAATRGCDAAITPARYDDIAPSLDSLQHCVEQNNLAAMLVDPADLVDPPALAPADAARIGLDVQPGPQRPTPAPGAAEPGSSEPGASAGSYGGALPPASTVPAPSAVAVPP